LTLQGPAADSAAAANYGLTLTYHDSTSTDPTAYGVLKIYRPTGQYQWMFNGSSSNTDRLAMRLDNGHVLTVYDPANPGDASSAIVLHPGSGAAGGGVYWNGNRLATAAEIPTNYVPFNIGGGVTIGTTSTPADLTVNGATTTTRLNLPATTDSNTGVVYQDGQKFLHSFGTNSTFLGSNAGNLSTAAQNNADNVGVGALTLSRIQNGTDELVTV